MRASAISLLLGLASFALGQQAQQPPAHVEDGGTREVLESIVIPSITHAPFTATLATEWARPLMDGGTSTIVNERHIARDGNGRIYEERWLLVPKNSNVKSVMNVVQIADPKAHTLYNCFIFRKICELTLYYPADEVTFEAAGGASGPLQNGIGFLAHENLGTKILMGVDTTGIRETTTINPWVMGNDRPIKTVREFWHSQQLGINLLSTRSNSRTGTQTFTITELSTSEPDPQLFTLPEGFQVADLRKTAPPSN